MKKQKRQMVVLLVLLVVCVGGYFGLQAYNRHTEEQEAALEEAEKLMAMDISAEDIQSMTYDYEGVTYTFTRDGENWIYPEDTTIDIRETVVETMAVRAASVEAYEKIEGVTDLAQYGLDSPESTAQLVTADHTYTICIGDYNSTISKYYMYVDNADVVYTVGATIASNFYKDLEDVKEEEVEEETTEETEGTEESAVTEEEGAAEAESENAVDADDATTIE